MRQFSQSAAERLHCASNTRISIWRKLLAVAEVKDVVERNAVS